MFRFLGYWWNHSPTYVTGCKLSKCCTIMLHKNNFIVYVMVIFLSVTSYLASLYCPHTFPSKKEKVLNMCLFQRFGNIGKISQNRYLISHYLQFTICETLSHQSARLESVTNPTAWGSGDLGYNANSFSSGFLSVWEHRYWFYFPDWMTVCLKKIKL